MERIDAVVIGAGVVGLAVARALAQAGLETLVLERERAIGSVTSARNSEVIHAGLYYASGSLKARLCVAGRERLYAYTAERGVPHRRCGKLIVASSEAQRAQLQAIERQAQANGVADLQWLGADEARALEPALACAAALRSPSTGIVDSHALMLALQGDLEHAGGSVALGSAVDRVELASAAAEGRHVVDAEGVTLGARVLVNAAGLDAAPLAQAMRGLPAACQPTAHYAKGSYFALASRAPFAHLIYPVPEAAGLGVHLTLDLAGQARFGPDVEWVRPQADGSFDYTVDPTRAAAFEAEVRRYWPGLPAGALQPAYSGVRPKLQGPGEPPQDFRLDGPAVHGVPGLVNLLGIESPGLTASLAIAEAVRERLGV